MPYQNPNQMSYVKYEGMGGWEVNKELNERERRADERRGTTAMTYPGTPMISESLAGNQNRNNSIRTPSTARSNAECLVLERLAW